MIAARFSERMDGWMEVWWRRRREVKAAEAGVCVCKLFVGVARREI